MQRRVVIKKKRRKQGRKRNAGKDNGSVRRGREERMGVRERERDSTRKRR